LSATQLEHLFREFFHGMRRSARSHMAPAVLMAVALFLLGLFLLGTINLQSVIRLAHERVGITVYLEDGASDDDRSHLKNLLSRWGGIQAVRYVSETEALQEFRSTLGGKAYLLEGVEGNPLPASFELDLYDDWKTATKMSELADEIRRQKGVESVVYGESWVAKLERWIYFFVAVDLFLGLVLGLSTLLVVGNTLKLAMADRRDAIEVLRLVGATRSQVRIPYLMEGAFLGFISALLALFLLHMSHQFAVERLPGVLSLGKAGGILFLLLGVVLGAGGAHLSIHKYLKARLT